MEDNEIKQDFEVISSNRGGDKIVLNGYVYTKQKKVAKGLRWVCIRRDGCRGAAVTTELYKNAEETISHNHPPNPMDAEKSRRKSMMRNKASSKELYLNRKRMKVNSRIRGKRDWPPADNDQPFREISDTIHGFIPLYYPLNLIVDTPEFQRLRNIKQVAFTSYVFPNADHSRFVHCLGFVALIAHNELLLKS
ncbi:hypothetical protein AB6A40_009109 [Gnathostoma spinigerum]|uniref:FLYWCH-type domain-containing protein n=1 Tax=Gnathostoma spinigerum TaxID=75299 RepID=A0ABD6ER04_9BILA